MGRDAWLAAVHGVTKNETRLSIHVQEEPTLGSL